MPLEENLKYKIINSNVFITDLDGTFGDLKPLKTAETIYRILKHIVQNKGKDYKGEIIHEIYPSFKEFISSIKCDKIIVTRNRPSIVKPLADYLNFKEVYYGNSLPESILEKYNYKKIIFAGNSKKDEAIFEKLKEKEKLGSIDYILGIFVGKNEKFDINLYNKDWKPLVELVCN
jgi:trehalose-6-phosphatase